MLRFLCSVVVGPSVEFVTRAEDEGETLGRYRCGLVLGFEILTCGVLGGRSDRGLSWPPNRPGLGFHSMPGFRQEDAPEHC